MNHPMYQDKVYAQALAAYTNDNARFMASLIVVGDDATGLLIMVRTMHEIAKNGHVLIDVDSSEWKSDITEKTISMLRPSDIKFPFKAGTIVDKSVDGDLVYFSIRDDKLYISFAIDRDSKDGLISQVVPFDKTFGEFTAEIPMTSAETYRAISVLMYVSAFKRDKSRVKENVTNKLKASKKRSIPSHRIHTVFIRQPNVTYAMSKAPGKSEMSWIVRGHWRNQWYKKEDVHKPKWIDPYWKGDGKKEIEKVYKV